MSEPAPAPPRPPKQWTGSVGPGVVSVTGNARSVTATLAAAAEHKGEHWIMGGKAYATYGESRVAGSPKVFGPLAVGVGFALNYDSAPPAQKIPWDTTLAITLDYLL